MPSVLKMGDFTDVFASGAASSTLPAVPGQSVENQYGDTFMFVQNGSADTNAVQYKLACPKTGAARGIVSMKDSEVTDGTLGTVTRPVGAWQVAVAFGGYGWLQTSGRGSLYTDDGVSDGDYLVNDGGATQTFICDTAVAGEEHGIFAQALAADNDTTHLVTAQIWKCW